MYIVHTVVAVYVCVCVCVRVMCQVTTQGLLLLICCGLGCSSELAYSFSELTNIPSPHGRPRIYHFGTLMGLCFLCMGLLCVEYQTGSHSPALKTGYDRFRRLYGISTLPAM